MIPIRHKAVIVERGGKKEWATACGVKWGTEPTKQKWADVRCKACRAHRPVRPKRINVQELLSGAV